MDTTLRIISGASRRRRGRAVVNRRVRAYSEVGGTHLETAMEPWLQQRPGSVARRCLVALLATAIFSPAPVWPQSERIRRVGYLAATEQAHAMAGGEVGEFLAGLRDLGWTEGRNLLVEWRFADGHYERLPALAQELVRLKVDVIVASTSSAIRAAQAATSRIPIVFPATGDPVGSGFVVSLVRPGGNITGLSNGNLAISAKTLELLSAIVPRIARVGVLLNPGSSTSPAFERNLGAAAEQLGLRLVPVHVDSAAGLDDAFATLEARQADALVIASDTLFALHQQRIAELALAHRLPAVSQDSGFPRAGGALGYGSVRTDNYRRAAAYVDKILRGANPADLPVEEPRRFRLVVNLRTARALGLVVPQAVLLRADEVIP